MKLYLLKENQRRGWNKSARDHSMWLLQSTVPINLPTNAEGFAQKSPDVVRGIQVSTALQVEIQAETFQNTLPDTLGLNWGVFFWKRFMGAPFHKAIFTLGVHIPVHLIREKENSEFCMGKGTFRKAFLPFPCCWGISLRNIKVDLKA